MKLYQSLLFVLFGWQIVLCQSSINDFGADLKGQYIIQLEPNADGYKIINRSVDQSRVGNPKLKQIMNQPLNLWLAEFKNDAEKEVLRKLRSNINVVHITPNRAITPRVLPNDPQINKQWQYVNNGSTGGINGADMDMDLAWDITTGGLSPSGDTIVVCVIDDGINQAHEDLKDNIWYNHGEIPLNGIDDDGNGYIDDFRGWNVTENNDSVFVAGVHGTPVCGIIGARGNNGIGVSGINWKVKIMMVDYGSATEANALASYGYAYTMRKLYNETNGKKGAYIVTTNSSWGINDAMADEAPLWCAIYDAMGSVGILSCGATANASTNVDTDGDLPTSCTSEFLISVTNINKSDVKVDQAGYGRKSIDIGAYGEQSFTVTRTGYGGFGGTSGATPHVAGTIALMYSLQCMKFDSLSKSNPAAAALIVKDMILNGTSNLPSLKDITTTGGKLNAFKAVSNLKTICETCTPPAGITLINEDESILVNWISGSETSVNLRYRKSDIEDWIVISNFKNGDKIIDLDHCTEYEIQLGSTCGYLPGLYGYSKFISTSGCCVAPTITDITSDQHSIGMNWTMPIESVFKLQYKLPASSEWTDTIIDTKSFLLSDLYECTAYQFRIQALCQKYEETSPHASTILKSTSCGNCTSQEYCNFGLIDANDEWIDTFSLGEIKNISGSSQSGYQDFAGLHLVTLSVGKKYPFSIKASYSGQAFVDYYRLLIDFNQNGLWDEEDMLFKTPLPVQYGVMDSITIPSTALPGITKMRVILSYEDFEGGCGSPDYEYGEIEDYCVLIDTTTLCQNNTSIQTLTEKTKLTFIPQYTNTNNQQIKIDFRPYLSNVWSSLVGQDSVVFDGLKECTLYEYRFQTYCGETLSETSVPDTIRTQCTINVIDYPDGISISPNPTNGTVTLHFDSDSIDPDNLQISDITGKNIRSHWSKTENDLVTDISHFNSGVYFIHIQDETGRIFIIKIIKI